MAVSSYKHNFSKTFFLKKKNLIFCYPQAYKIQNKHERKSIHLDIRFGNFQIVFHNRVSTFGLLIFCLRFIESSSEILSILGMMHEKTLRLWFFEQIFKNFYQKGNYSIELTE